MLAALLQAPGNLQLENRDIPQAGPGEVVIKVEANTICGTDLRLYTGEKTSGVRYGVVPGHEIAGRVFEIGEGVTQFYPSLTVGTQATISIVLACGICSQCLADREHYCENMELFGYNIDGGLQEYLVVPAKAVRRGNLFPVSTPLPPAHLCLAEPISCCINGMNNFGVNLGETIVILGAGPIGLIQVQLALLAGAGQVIISNRSAARREMAEQFGATAVHPDFLEKTVFQMTAGRGADVVIQCIGVPDLAGLALQLVRKGGRVNYFAGFPKGSTSTLDMNLIHYNDITVTGGSNARRRDVAKAIDLLQSGQINVDTFITHEFALADVAGAFATVKNREGIKVAVRPHQ
ncbi:MAG: alcohol dehydrogenase catalytic domain-containing protein [Actinomycetaceae bacterium]|nr:alcohol dehydrogenase catalytic domain-containing protein [Actinomycetaceae bacterium]